MCIQQRDQYCIYVVNDEKDNKIVMNENREETSGFYLDVNTHHYIVIERKLCYKWKWRGCF